MDIEISHNIAYKRILDVIETGAQIVISACPACKGNLKLAADRARKEKKGKVRVMDIGEVVSRASRKT